MLLAEMNWPAMADLSRDVPVVIPIAALEQHGEMLPFFTDSMILGEIVRRCAPQLTDTALFTPLMWLGNSLHHLEFPGTMSAAPRGYIDLLKDMAGNFLGHDFKRLVFLNGHGGNIIPSQQAIFELRQEYRTRADRLLLATTYWHHAKKVDTRAIGMQQEQMMHADEWETSMMLRIAPHLVGDVRQASDVAYDHGFEPAYRGWITRDRSARGHIGTPRHATAEKGERLLEIFTAALVSFLERVSAWDGSPWR